jgi:hypothetical protein
MNTTLSVAAVLSSPAAYLRAVRERRARDRRQRSRMAYLLWQVAEQIGDGEAEPVGRQRRDPPERGLRPHRLWESGRGHPLPAERTSPRRAKPWCRSRACSSKPARPQGGPPG